MDALSRLSRCTVEADHGDDEGGGGVALSSVL